MRHIEYEKIVQSVSSLCIEAAHHLPADVLEALTAALKNETSNLAKKILSQLIENAQIASSENIPLCQDTGLAVVFVQQGCDVIIKSPPGKTLFDAINQGVATGYEDGFLRKSVVAEPLNQRKNTNTNTPAIIHHSVVSGDSLKISVIIKGGGCENKSSFKMFKPTAEKTEIIKWVCEVVKQAGADACPPFVVGVGLGGNFELSCLLSKKALLRKIGQRNSEPFYAELELLMLEEINSLGLGPQGLGGLTTALDCLVENAPCHIASLPVAVNIECHSHRHKSITL